MFVELTLENDKSIRVNPALVETYGEHPQSKNWCSVTMASGRIWIVSEPADEVTRKLTSFFPVEELAQPVEVVIQCKNCGQPRDSHKLNWLGGWNCNVVANDYQDRPVWEPEVA